jgi:hypothetical protein
MITDEMVEVAAERIFKHWMFQPKDRLPVKWTPDGNSEKQAEARLYAIAAIEAVLPMIRADVLEECAKWHDAEAKRWNVELWERRSWGGPTIGEGECLEHIKAHEHSATTIRAMKGGET